MSDEETIESLKRTIEFQKELLKKKNRLIARLSLGSGAKFFESELQETHKKLGKQFSNT